MDNTKNCQRILDSLFTKEWKIATVLAVTFPAPPVSAKGVIYAEDCWMSDVLDRADGIFSESEGRIIDKKFTDRGPAFLIEYDLIKLFSWYDKIAALSTYCATISYENMFEESGIMWAKNAILERCSRGMGSCHPGSHTAVPMAPFMTLMLQASRTASVKSNNLYADDSDCLKYFPGHDYSRNFEADKNFSMLCPYFVSGISSKSVCSGLSVRMKTEYVPRFNANATIWHRCGNDTAKVKRLFEIKNAKDSVQLVGS